MFSCGVCGSTQARLEYVDEVFAIDGRRVLVEHIPAQTCLRCGEPAFSRETVERVRRLVQSEMPPEKTIPMEVFALT